MSAERTLLVSWKSSACDGDDDRASMSMIQQQRVGSGATIPSTSTQSRCLLSPFTLLLLLASAQLSVGDHARSLGTISESFVLRTSSLLLKQDSSRQPPAGSPLRGWSNDQVQHPRMQQQVLPLQQRHRWNIPRGGAESLSSNNNYPNGRTVPETYDEAYSQQRMYPDTARAQASADDGVTSTRSYESTTDPTNYPNAAVFDQDDTNNVDALMHETVQDRVNSWRQAQMEQSSRLQESYRDDQGRLKLLTGVSRGSRAVIFVCLVFRTLHLFEVADQQLKGLRRLLVVIPLIALFVGNLAGVVASFTSPSHSAKKRLKAILNLDKLVEVSLIVWNVGRLTVAPSQYVPREIFISSSLHSVFFLLQCQAYTRLTWDENAAGAALAPPATSSLENNSQVPFADEDRRLSEEQVEDSWYGGFNDPSHPFENDDGIGGQRPTYDNGASEFR